MLVEMSGSSVAIQQFPRRLGRGAVTAVLAIACLLAAPGAARATGVNPSDGQISAAQLATAESQAGHAEAVANIALGRFEATQADYQRAQAAAEQAQDAARRAQ